jgi:hypothetical protein
VRLRQPAIMDCPFFGDVQDVHFRAEEPGRKVANEPGFSVPDSSACSLFLVRDFRGQCPHILFLGFVQGAACSLASCGSTCRQCSTPACGVFVVCRPLAWHRVPNPEKRTLLHPQSMQNAG